MVVSRNGVQDDSFAAAFSPVVGATVEDYKGVEARIAAAKAKALAAADAESLKHAGGLGIELS